MVGSISIITMVPALDIGEVARDRMQRADAEQGGDAAVAVAASMRPFP
jgi:hypothetical protein